MLNQKNMLLSDRSKGTIFANPFVLEFLGIECRCGGTTKVMFLFEMNTGPNPTQFVYFFSWCVDNKCAFEFRAAVHFARLR